MKNKEGFPLYGRCGVQIEYILFIAKRIVKIEGRLNVRKMRREEKQDTKIDIMFS